MSVTGGESYFLTKKTKLPKTIIRRRTAEGTTQVEKKYDGSRIVETGTGKDKEVEYYETVNRPVSYEETRYDSVTGRQTYWGVEYDLLGKPLRTLMGAAQTFMPKAGVEPAYLTPAGFEPKPGVKWKSETEKRTAIEKTKSMIKEGSYQQWRYSQPSARAAYAPRESTAYPVFEPTEIRRTGAIPITLTPVRGVGDFPQRLEREAAARRDIEARGRMSTRYRETAGGVAQEKYLVYSSLPLILPSAVGTAYRPEKEARYGTMYDIQAMPEEARRERYMTFASKGETKGKTLEARYGEEYGEAKYAAESKEAYLARGWDVGVGALEIGGGGAAVAKGVTMTLPQAAQTMGVWGTAGVVGKKAGIETYKATDSELAAMGVDIGFTIAGGAALSRLTTPLVRRFETPKFKKMEQRTQLYGEELSYPAKGITEAEHKFLTITKTPGGRTLYKGKAWTTTKGKLEADVLSKISMKKMGVARPPGLTGRYRAWVHKLPKEPKYTAGYELKLVGETKKTAIKGLEVSKYTGYISKGRTISPKMKPMDFKGVQDIVATHRIGKKATVSRGFIKGGITEKGGSIFKPKITGKTYFAVGTRPGALSTIMGRAGGKLSISKAADTRYATWVKGKPPKAGIQLSKHVPKKTKWKPYELKTKQMQAAITRGRVQAQEFAYPASMAMEKLTPLSGVGMMPQLTTRYPKLEYAPAQKQLMRLDLKTATKQLTRTAQEPFTLTKTSTRSMMQVPQTRTRAGLLPQLKQPKADFTIGELTTKSMTEQLITPKGALSMPKVAKTRGVGFMPYLEPMGGMLPLIPPMGLTLPPTKESRRMPKGFYEFGKRRKAKIIPLTGAGVDKILKGLIPYSRRLKKKLK